MENRKHNEQDLMMSLHRLSNALWNEERDDISHDECRAALPQFVEDELAGVSVAEKYPRVQQHLDYCADCGEEYAMLLDLAMAERRGELNLEIPVQERAAQTSGEVTRLESLVLEWTRGLVELLAPSSLGSLDEVAARFFRQMQVRQASETRAVYDTDQKSSTAVSALLAASYTTTRAFCDDVTPEQFDALAQNGALANEIQKRAEITARGLGMEERLAQEFGKRYAEMVMKEPEGMRELIVSNS